MQITVIDGVIYLDGVRVGALDDDARPNYRRRVEEAIHGKRAR